jgi:hypothetical protein
MRFISIFIFAISITAFSNTSFAQQLSAEMKMHRMQSGTLDGTGWVQANSTGGGHSVSLPCIFNDWTFDDSEKDRSSIPMHTVGCKLPNGLTYSATMFEYPGGDLQAQNMFEEFKNEKAHVLYKFEGVQLNRAFAQVSTARGKPCAESRMIRNGKSNIVLIVDTIQGKCFNFKSDASKFFNSLVIEK